MTYSSSLASGRRKFASRHHNAVSFKEQVKTLGPVSNTVILVVLSCLLGLLYLTQVTKTNANGYEIDSLQKRHTALQKEHDDLELSAARLQSLQRVAESDANKSLVSLTPSATLQ
jgi:hypothetical protein